MTPRYPPTITIGGTVLPTGWSGGLVAVDTLRTIWGRATLADEPKPTELALTIIDPDGAWATSATLYGAAVVVTTAISTVFRGTVDTISLAPVTIRNPDTGRPQDVYVITLGAICTTADLHKTFPAGPGGSAFENAQYGATHHPVRIKSVLQTFVKSAASKIVAGVTVDDNSSELNYAFARRESSENVSIAEFIRELYLVQALSWLNYDPASNIVNCGVITPATLRALTYTNNRLSLTGPGVHTIPGRHVQATGSGAIELGLQDNVSAVVHTYADYVQGPSIRWNNVDYATNEMRPRSGSTTSPYLDGVGGSNTYEIKSGMLELPGYATPGRLTVNAAFRYGYLNGQFSAPEMLFDLERSTYPAAFESILLSTKTTSESLYIMGTEYTKLAGFLPHFQIVGGTLEYDEGWTFAPHLAPTRNPKVGTLTVNQIVTNTLATISQYDPDLCLADLGTLDTGAA